MKTFKHFITEGAIDKLFAFSQDLSMALKNAKVEIKKSIVNFTEDPNNHISGKFEQLKHDIEFSLKDEIKPLIGKYKFDSYINDIIFVFNNTPSGAHFDSNSKAIVVFLKNVEKLDLDNQNSHYEYNRIYSNIIHEMIHAFSIKLLNKNKNYLKPSPASTSIQTATNYVEYALQTIEFEAQIVGYAFLFAKYFNTTEKMLRYFDDIKKIAIEFSNDRDFQREGYIDIEQITTRISQLTREYNLREMAPGYIYAICVLLSKRKSEPYTRPLERVLNWIKKLISYHKKIKIFEREANRRSNI
jgi:hypothetical protein